MPKISTQKKIAFPYFFMRKSLQLAVFITTLHRSDSLLIQAQLSRFAPGNIEALTIFVSRNCSDCHSGESPAKGIRLDNFVNGGDIRRDWRIWKSAIDQLRNSKMPPSDSNQPSPVERSEAIACIESQLLNTRSPIDSQRVYFKRLNRLQYFNTVNDLLGYTMQGTDILPADETACGFENISDALSMQPLVMEKYLEAAESISHAVIVAEHPEKCIQNFDVLKWESDNSTRIAKDGSLVFVSNGIAKNKVFFPCDGEFTVKVISYADRAGDELARLEMLFDEKVIASTDLSGHREHQTIDINIMATLGDHEFAIRYPNDFQLGNSDRNLYVVSIAMEGPMNLPLLLPQSHHQLIRFSPTSDLTAEIAAMKNLQEFLPKAFRRPVTMDEVKKYSDFVKKQMQNGNDFNRSMQLVVQAILVSPHFLFRVEGVNKQHNQPKLGNFELASRLSYFLWATMPDSELTAEAISGRLVSDEVLVAQTKRMLKDPRAMSLTKGFAAPWLGLRQIEQKQMIPSRVDFPFMNEQLITDMLQETYLFFDSLILEDRSIYDLVEANYTFLNESLAQHYGVAGVNGNNFRRVELNGVPRLGVLTHGSVLLTTSFPTRTSPTKRGAWVLSKFLGVDLGPAPSVPELDLSHGDISSSSLREQLQSHASNSSCAACHREMDGIGFGLENFDAVGRWRTSDKQGIIKAYGILPSGKNFSNPVELVDGLSKEKSAFISNFAEQLLIYALGRDLTYRDRQEVDRICLSLQKDSSSFSSLVLEIVRSESFRNREP